MLAELRIENLLLIHTVRVDFDPGFNAFTGETGAGKSLLLDAIQFLLGAKSEISAIRSGAEQAEVSARFVLSDPELAASFRRDLGIAFDDTDGAGFELVLSRILPTSGRSRAHANGRPIALPALRELGERLLDIHGQNENQSLLRAGTRLEILDRFSEAQTERDAVSAAHRAAQECARRLAELRRAARDRQGREELLRFQVQELRDGQLDEFDFAEAENEIKLLKGAEKIRGAAQAAAEALDGEDSEGAAQWVARALKALLTAGDAGTQLAALKCRGDSLLADARDLAQEIRDLAERASSDPARLEELEDAASRIKTLQRKHGRDREALIELRDKLEGELTTLDHLEVRTEAAEKELAAAVAALREKCAALSQKRKTGARQLEKKVNLELRGMGFAHATLQVRLSPHSPGETHAAEGVGEGDPLDREAARLLPADAKASGAENAEILFSGNPDLPPKALKDCASGGEIARVMLALKGVLARAGGADRLPVMVFDEVDSGVGGRLGSVLGKKLRDLAAVRQVICVTHQPQLAACAHRQFKVSKMQVNRATVVTVLAVEGEKRIDELASMLRGSEASARTREEAAAMLQMQEART